MTKPSVALKHTKRVWLGCMLSTLHLGGDHSHHQTNTTSIQCVMTALNVPSMILQPRQSWCLKCCMATCRPNAPTFVASHLVQQGTYKLQALLPLRCCQGPQHTFLRTQWDWPPQISSEGITLAPLHCTCGGGIHGAKVNFPRLVRPKIKGAFPSAMVPWRFL